MLKECSNFIGAAGALIAAFFSLPPGVAAASPTQGDWALVDPLPFFPVHIHLLPTGKVMIWPGATTSGNDPRLWDPETQNVSPLSKPGINLFCSGHTFLADGKLFVAGGHNKKGEGLAQASTYDPFSNSWRTNLPSMNAGRWYPTTTLLGNGNVLVISGKTDNTFGVNALPQVFRTASNTWRDLTNAVLSMVLYPQMFLAPNGKIFKAGAEKLTRYLDISGSGEWTDVGQRVSGNRSYGSAVMYAPGKILSVGGGDPPTKTAEVIDLNVPSPTWRPVGSLTFSRRQINAVLLADGKVLVTGGTSGPGFSNETTPVFAAELWDPATENWSVMDSALIPRLYHSATLLLPDGRVLSTGGNGHPDTEIYSPPYLFQPGARPTITSAPTSVAYDESFFVKTPDATAITKVRMIKLSSTTHAFNMAQHPAEPTSSQTEGGLSVTAPANGNIAPPGHYLLFILNGSGVPSIAKIVQLGGAAAPPLRLAPRWPRYS